MTPEKDLVGLC